MNNEKIYAPITAKEIVTTHGPMLKLGVRVDEMIEFLKKHRNENGWLNLIVSERKTHSDISTHSVALDTWKPKEKSSGSNFSRMKKKVQVVPEAGGEENDEIPF